MNNAKRIADTRQAIENLREAIRTVEANPDPATAKLALNEYRHNLREQETLLARLEKRSC